MRTDFFLIVAALTAAALLAGCGGRPDVLNEELDVSGEYSLVLADTDPATLVNLETDLSGSLNTSSPSPTGSPTPTPWSW